MLVHINLCKWITPSGICRLTDADGEKEEEDRSEDAALGEPAGAEVRGEMESKLRDVYYSVNLVFI